VKRPQHKPAVTPPRHEPVPPALAGHAFLGWVRQGGVWRAAAGAATYRDCWQRLEQGHGGTGQLLVVRRGVLP
jgi:hypothetical protein